MIKTVSFSSPARPAPAKPSSKVAARGAAIAAAKAKQQRQAQEQPSLFALPESLPEISAAQARELIAAPAKAASKARVPASATAPQAVSGEAKGMVVNPSAVDEAAKDLARAQAQLSPSETPAVAVKKSVSSAKRTVAAPSVEVQSPVAVVAVSEVATTKAPKRAKRTTIPANLAEQYGQNLSKRVEGAVEAAPIEEDAPKKRLSRAERAARRELMLPGDDLKARLQRMQNISAPIRTEKRGRGWRFDCGRCGQTAYFQTNGALCGCGAFALKD